MASFTIDFLTSDKCGKLSQTSQRSVNVGTSSEFPTPPGSDSGSPPDPKPDIDGHLHALQIQANKLKAKEKKTKVKHSFVALISEAILYHPSRRLLLNEIYSFIRDKYPQFDKEDKSWKNSVRHNLSLNECFVKVGRCERGHYWSIHPSVVGEFARGNFTRRLARRRVRRNQAEDSELQHCLSYSPVNSSSASQRTAQSQIRLTPRQAPVLSDSSASVDVTSPTSSLTSTEQHHTFSPPYTSGISSTTITHGLPSPKTSLAFSLPIYWPTNSSVTTSSPSQFRNTSMSRDLYLMTSSESALLASPRLPFPSTSTFPLMPPAQYMQHYQMMLQMAQGLPTSKTQWR